MGGDGGAGALAWLGCVPAAAALDRGELAWRQRSAEHIPTVARGVMRQGRARVVATLGRACPHGGVTRQGRVRAAVVACPRGDEDQ